MNPRLLNRLGDILTAIDDAALLLAGRSLADLHRDRNIRAAYERYLEIVSEASRHIPEDLKLAEPEIPWRQIAGIGNRLRHAYHDVDIEALWLIHANRNLLALRAAIIRIREALIPE